MIEIPHKIQIKPQTFPHFQQRPYQAYQKVYVIEEFYIAIKSPHKKKIIRYLFLQPVKELTQGNSIFNLR